MSKATTTDLIKSVSGSVTSQGATTETEIAVSPGKQSKVQLRSFRAVRSSGTAANWQPRIGRVSGWTDDDISEMVTFASDALVRKNETFNPPVPVLTDANGSLWLQLGWDAGADNAADYAFEIEIEADA